MRFEGENKTDLLVGQFCISKQGRDKGKLYIVYEIVDEDYVLLLDGKYRKIKNPKKKNIKHLQRINDIVKDFKYNIIQNNLDDVKIKRLIKLKERTLINVK